MYNFNKLNTLVVTGLKRQNVALSQGISLVKNKTQINIHNNLHISIYFVVF